MFRQALGVGGTARRDPNFGVHYVKNWTKYGKIDWVFRCGRNCVYLESKKRASRLRYRPTLHKGLRYKVTVDVFSPIGQDTVGMGTVNGVYDGAQGHWKRIGAPLNAGDEIVLAATGFDGKHAAGDWCLFDLSTVKIERSDY